MSRTCFWITPLALVLLLSPMVSFAQSTAAPRDWITWGYDQERTGWNRGETVLSKDNVSGLKLKWSTQLSTQPKEVALSTLTAPLVVEGVNTPQGRKTLVFVVGSDDTVFAIDADSGKVLWQKTFPNKLTPRQAATWLCSNTQNATPVIDRQKAVIYLNTSDVIHSFFLPNLRLKQDALPGKTIPVWFSASESNAAWDTETKKTEVSRIWDLACAELCGWGHHKMRGQLYVHSDKANYDLWLDHMQKETQRRER